MYADIAVHRAVRSWFLRLIVNVVICALLWSFANKEYVPIYSCVVITKYDNITSCIVINMYAIMIEYRLDAS